MKKKIFIHHHIFKNAGTSIDKSFKEIFGDHMYFYDMNIPGGVVSNHMLIDFIYKKINGFPACISSHQTCLSVKGANNFKFIEFVMLRNPLRRFLSMYNYYKRIQLSGDKLENLAKEKTFREFVEYISNNSKVISSNFQTNFCSKTDSIRRKIVKDDLERAKDNLSHNVKNIGVVERFNDSVKIFNQVLRENEINGEMIIYKENSSRDILDPIKYIKDSLGTSLYHKVKAQNVFDFELYNFANKLLDIRVENL
ncbi:MAG: hypothetical protein CSA34_01020 [Desulfobulbus propionicus]|nr:MAG: hypothetical protein CSA34_01020 [Desulfobulbus propionicus]